MKVTQSSSTLRPHGPYNPWESPGQNAGMGSLFLLWGSSQPRDGTQVFHIAGEFFTSWATREAQEYWVGSLSLLQGIFLTQELNWGLLHCRRIVYQLGYEGSPLNSKESFEHALASAPWGSFPFTAPTGPLTQPLSRGTGHSCTSVTAHAASSAYKAFSPCTPVNFPPYILF